MKAAFSFDFDKRELDLFNAQCQAAIRNIGRGTKKATVAACEEILEMSLQQVPTETGTLAASAFYEVNRRSDTAATTWAYEATVGYGGNGDPVHPHTGQHASQYMVIVHEDLTALHSAGQKAKFLEDPVREYAKERFQRTVFTYAKESLASMSD